MSKNTNTQKELQNETVIAQSAMERRANRRKGRGGDETADWESCDATLIQGLIAIVSINKGTVTFGYTRDGGAYFISYYFGESSEKVYCRPSEGIDTFLAYEIESFAN